MRKLVSVQKVKDILPIDGADKIELAIINGWQVVVKKGEFKVGDLAVYFEIDSWVPHEIAPFLTEEGKEPKEFEGVKGQRLKTKKLRKQLSQGLLLPLNGALMTKFGNNPVTVEGLGEGDDVTEILGVKKWEAPEEGSNNGTRIAGSSTGKKFPAFIRKTDQERIQNYGALVERALDEEFEATIKKDGSSLTVFRVDPKSPYYKDAKALTNTKLNWFQRVIHWGADLINGKEPIRGICSRNLLLKLDGDSNFHKGVYQNNLLAKLEAMGGSYALQLELVAPDIQGNYEKVEGVEVHLFDIYDIDRQEYVLPLERTRIAADYGIPHVTVLDRGTLRQILNMQEGDDVVKKALDYAEGAGDNPGVKREGVVFKAIKRDFSFKAVSNSYLLATGK